MASGTVNMMINGSIKLSNCAARIRKISASASMKAKLVLLELSAKSLDEPESEVVKDGSSTWCSNFLHFLYSIANRFSGCKSRRNGGRFIPVEVINGRRCIGLLESYEVIQ